MLVCIYVDVETYEMNTRNQNKRKNMNRIKI